MVGEASVHSKPANCRH